jgi:uroporphyrin-III C-methyltransferase / precorrin-2 dehydrogenase / sirohydrochlorin ferrochelatase
MAHSGCIAKELAVSALADCALMHSLPIFVRLAGRSVILLGSGEAAEAKRRLLNRAGALCVDENASAALAIVAIEEDAPAFEAIQRLKDRGIMVNAVDRPELCDFTVPAIVDRDPVIIAIGTGGASAGLAKALRIRLEALLPAGLGSIATLLAQSREAIRARWPGPRDRRLAVDAALDPGGPLDPFAVVHPNAVDQWLASAAVATPPALLYLMITSDDPDDLTLAQARWLGKADQVFYHPRIAPDILDRARADATRIACVVPPETPRSGLSLFLDRA